MKKVRYRLELGSETRLCLFFNTEWGGMCRMVVCNGCHAQVMCAGMEIILAQPCE